jgi:hypothetical protein
MKNINVIIHEIDKFLDQKKLKKTTPVDVAPYLDKIGVLKNTPDRNGKPLRDLLRKKLIPHAYQNSSKNWFIPLSNSNDLAFTIDYPERYVKQDKSKQIDPIISNSNNEQHKLKPIADLIIKILKEKTGIDTYYVLEYKPTWLLTYPTLNTLNKNQQIQKVYEALTNKKIDIRQVIQRLEPKQKSQKQSFDIWIAEPFNFAVEFDESQHFNQFRLKTLKYYQDFKVNFSVPDYQNYNQTEIKASTSGFAKLKSKDPLFPPMLPGEKQDNRIRQRAFRDFLKDILPLENDFNPTLRIPYHLTNKKIKDFTDEDLQQIGVYVGKFIY